MLVVLLATGSVVVCFVVPQPGFGSVVVCFVVPQPGLLVPVNVLIPQFGLLVVCIEESGALFVLRYHPLVPFSVLERWAAASCAASRASLSFASLSALSCSFFMCSWCAITLAAALSCCLARSFSV